MSDSDWCNLHVVPPGTPVSLDKGKAKGKSFCDDRAVADAEFHALRAELAETQNRFYAERKHKLLIVFQAMDAGGKDGTIRNVFRGVNPQGVKVTSFKAPSSLERSHDYLWRIHQATPAKGMIGIFNRSHYEDVLVVRVDQLVEKSIWKQRYEQINQFEHFLHSTGTTILKFFLHISKNEQRKRFEERRDLPEKHWKFSVEDLAKRKQWEDYMAAYEDVLFRCSTEWAPWYIIPSNQKWYRNLAVSRIIMAHLRRLDPQFPTPEIGLENITIQ